jgi:uncharacterized protein (DUF169 family)
LLWSDEKPEGAIQFQEGKWGCVMWLFAAAAEGKTAVCDQKTFGCFGGGVGFGFGDQYKNFPGGADCFCRFLSTGNEQSEEGRRTAERIKPYMSEHAHEEFLQGERYIKSPELVGDFIKNTPVAQIPTRYVVLKPLDAVDPERETPQVVVFLADPNQLSALTVLANYGRESCESVIIPFAAGCQAVGVYPYREALAEHPRAVVGLVDISARLQLKKRFGMNLLTLAVPYGMFQEMEKNVPGSFLERPTWKELVS